MPHVHLVFGWFVLRFIVPTGRRTFLRVQPSHGEQHREEQ